MNGFAMKRCAQCHGKLGLGVRSRNLWNGRWWIHVLKYVGTAYIFSSQCGKFEYEVRGEILDNYRRVQLSGQAPRIDDNCNIIGRLPDKLEFSLIDR
jgi:hypothetical protein